ncbi:MULTISPECIES: amino acid--[acyl-carrier-protein] ligase [Ramlibacter]|uniref:Amino acid--[acyl-carrier-protein] ligase n=1 Tax=Ramlibacter pinisoli TaxID=2682844 RepID=A0A6N8IYT9_9BURK|nr:MULTISPECIES: amino acid--[acyl-carrier-protein] ligase [Ramlibacter]MBA2962212.1 amino acid--[acyl-carrier-protein] ligase [Ramlibacter sp. CGMCC 1.13660]MVQ32154.1 amino acid--[acyl-carrier-protein] ligase [Ramlibacter pinisoli]
MDIRTYEIHGFTEALIENGLIVPTGIAGAYGRGPVFEDILRRFDDLVTRTAAPDNAQELMFPPILARALIEKVGYMDNFPQLAGSVHSFRGSDQQARELSARVHAGERWEDLLAPTDVMLTPAACYPVYPTFSGLLPAGGRLVTVMNWVFRHEPSDEPTRLQHFRMREYIRVGRPDEVVAWRDAWLQRGLELLRGLQLPVDSDVASDPFFGRAGRMMAANQVDQRLKFEILCPVISREKPTAICSFNWHQDHFSGKFGILNADSSVAHTACLGFGLERVTLALIKTHGYDPADWPQTVRAQLWP